MCDKLRKKSEYFDLEVRIAKLESLVRSIQTETIAINNVLERLSDNQKKRTIK